MVQLSALPQGMGSRVVGKWRHLQMVLRRLPMALTLGLLVLLNSPSGLPRDHGVQHPTWSIRATRISFCGDPKTCEKAIIDGASNGSGTRSQDARNKPSGSTRTVDLPRQKKTPCLETTNTLSRASSIRTLCLLGTCGASGAATTQRSYRANGTCCHRVQKCRDLMLDADNNAPADGDDPPLADDAKEDEGDASDGDSGVSVAPPETVATSVTIQADDEVTMVLPDVGGRRLVRISCAAPKPVLETMEKMNTLQPPALKKGKGDDDGDAVCEVGGGGSNSINSDAIRNKPAAAKTAAKKRPAAAAVAGGENAAGNKKTKYTVVEATAVPQEKTQAAVEYLGSFACGKEYFNKLPPCTYPNNVDIDLQKRSWTRHIRATGGALEVSVEVNAAKKHFYVVKGVDDNTRRQAGIPSAGEKRNYGWGRSEDSCLEAWKKACVRAGLPGWESFVLK
eukprot:TRINITY_DN2076_c0_g1_i3.p1 TRINITY_DN2076_c0_g1~~TRINITY_DN2076_c0_g1_i3.p1  ORF type:complete len:451 (-),score=115.14 TRINITY_DN2076_c0_g1_i3:246-1598(-)